MIGDVLLLLKNQLNSHLKSLSPGGAGGAGEDIVAFLDLDQKPDSAAFKSGAVTILLYRIEQEPAARQGDPFLRVAVNGAFSKVKPDINLNLYVLIASRFKDYVQGLQYLAQAVKFFQSNKVFNRQNTPNLGRGIAELTVDMVAMTPQQENEVWSLLRTSYLPSVAYKIRTVTFRDEDGAPGGEGIAEIDRQGLS